jgi:hypothetical protein
MQRSLPLPLMSLPALLIVVYLLYNRPLRPDLVKLQYVRRGTRHQSAMINSAARRDDRYQEYLSPRSPRSL